MIPFVDFTREYRALKEEIDDAVKRVMNRGHFILGPEVASFERAFGSYIGTSFAVGVASGTDALYLSLCAAGIGKGDEVIVPANTAVATAMAVVMSGAAPVFVDCDRSHLIDVAQAEAAVTQKTKALVPVHLYGRACDMDALSALAKRHHLTLIEDCAQAAGAEWRGQKVGGFGDFGCFSFYPTKTLGAYGDGGAVVTKSAHYHRALLGLRFYGQSDRMTCLGFGVNSRLDELQAAILNVKIAYLDVWNKKRQAIAQQYRLLIANPDILLSEPASDSEHVYHLFVARSRRRSTVMKKLKEAGVESLIHYSVPLHRQPFFNKFARGEFPVAERFSEEIFSLPLYPFLSGKEINKIARLLNAL